MWDVLSGVAEMAWDVMSGVTQTAWDVMSGATKSAWDVLSGVANLCGMFCSGWQTMAWDVLSPDVLSGSCNVVMAKYPIAPSKANAGVDWPMEAPSMHIQK